MTKYLSESSHRSAETSLGYGFAAYHSMVLAREDGDLEIRQTPTRHFDYLRLGVYEQILRAAACRPRGMAAPIQRQTS